MRAPLTDDLAPAPRAGLWSQAGRAVFEVAKAVISRTLLWAAIGFVVGLVLAPISATIVFFTLDRGAAVLWPLVVAPAVLPFLGAALFGFHGSHRGIARAALALEQRFGLVLHVVERVMAFLEQRIGGPVSNLPLETIQRYVTEAMDRYLGSDDMNEGRGVAGWVVRTSKRAVVRRIERYTLAAYRAESDGAGAGGGVSIAKVRDRVATELSTNLASLVMSPLDKQLGIFLVGFVALGLGWFHLVLLIIRLLGRSLGQA